MGIKREGKTFLSWSLPNWVPRILDTSLSVTVYGTIWILMGITQSNLHVASYEA